MNDCLIIPERIVVGFQNTPTRRIGIISHFRRKTIVRKPTWDSLRDKTIPPEEFENVPTSGFVLLIPDFNNWLSQYTLTCNVIDPRGFDFSISTVNLLRILKRSDCLGRRLEGTFVYAWENSELVLLPTVDEDYIETRKTMEKIENSKIKKWDDLVIGKKYRIKDRNRDEEVYYLGNLKWSTVQYDWYKGIYQALVTEHNTFLNPMPASASPSSINIFGLGTTGIKKILYPIESGDLQKHELDEILYRFKSSPAGKGDVISKLKIKENSKIKDSLQETWEFIKAGDFSLVGRKILIGKQMSPSSIYFLEGEIYKESSFLSKGELCIKKISFSEAFIQNGYVKFNNTYYYHSKESEKIKNLEDYTLLGHDNPGGGSLDSEKNLSVWISDQWFNYDAYIFPQNTDILI